jgi:hypothetical protein
LLRYAPLYTVFSAPNYSDLYKNKGGFLALHAHSGLAFSALSWADHPYHLKDFQNGLEFSLPFLMDHMTRLIVGLLKARPVFPVCFFCSDSACRWCAGPRGATARRRSGWTPRYASWKSGIVSRTRCARSARPSSRSCAISPRAAPTRSSSAAPSKWSDCLVFLFLSSLTIVDQDATVEMMSPLNLQKPDAEQRSKRRFSSYF